MKLRKNKLYIIKHQDNFKCLALNNKLWSGLGISKARISKVRHKLNITAIKQENDMCVQLCKILNAEPGERPLTDIQITRELCIRGITCTKQTISYIRQALKIPSTAKNQMLTRKYLYYTQGRWKWEPNGKHIKPLKS